MCDYSLQVYRNRLARDGEELVARRFPAGCAGFISAAGLPAHSTRATWLGIDWPQFKAWLLPRLRYGLGFRDGQQILLPSIPDRLLALATSTTLLPTEEDRVSYTAGFAG